jgi:hypothetical protein
MTDTLLENGDEKRASLKLKSSHQDHLKALQQVHSKIQQSFKLLGISNVVLAYQSSNTPMRTANKAASFSPMAKGRPPRRSTFLLH